MLCISGPAGTDSDLRKLGFEDSGVVLQKFGIPKAEIADITNRWSRIDLVRKLCTQALALGMQVDGVNIKAWARKEGFQSGDNRRLISEKCQSVWQAQLKQLKFRSSVTTPPPQPQVRQSFSLLEFHLYLHCIRVDIVLILMLHIGVCQQYCAIIGKPTIA